MEDQENTVINHDLVISEQVIRAALDYVRDIVDDPDKGKGLSESGRVENVLLRPGGRVLVTLCVRAGEQEAMLAPLAEAARAALIALPGISEAQILLTAHDAGPAGGRPSPSGMRLRKDAPPEALPGPVSRARPAGQSPASVVGPAHVRRMIAVASGKGGVGKSTLAVNLALALSQLGQRVGILDADIYGPSIPLMLGLGGASPEIGPDRKLIPLSAFGLRAMSIGFLVDPESPMIWRGPIVSSAIVQMLNDVAWASAEAPLDILVVDMPPGTGDAQLTFAQRTALSGAVIVSTPQEMALADARRGLKMFQKTHAPVLGLVENMAFYVEQSGARSYIFGRDGVKRLAEAENVPFLGEIPLDPALRVGGDEGAPLIITDPNSATAGAIMAIARQVADALESETGLKPPPEIRFVP